MKFKKILEIALHRAIRNRNRNLIIGIPIMITMIILLVINMIQYSTKQYINSIKENIEMRTIDGIKYTETQYNEILSKLENIEHVEMVVDMYERQVYADTYSEKLKTENANGYISIRPINDKTCPDVIYGRKIQNNDKLINHIYQHQNLGF